MPDNEERRGLFGRFFDNLKTWWTSKLEAEREFWTKKTPDLFKKVIQGITSGIGEFQEDNWIDMLTMFKQLGFVDDDDIKNLMNARKAVPLLDAFLYVWTFFTFIQIYIGTTGGILGGTYRQNMNKLYSPNPPNHRQDRIAIRCAALATPTTGSIPEPARRHSPGRW